MLRSKAQNATYLSIVLKSLSELIENFVGLSLDEVLVQSKCKQLIVSFEKIRQDLFSKLKASLGVTQIPGQPEDSPATTSSGLTFSKEKIRLI